MPRPNIIFAFSDEHRWCSLPFTETPQVVAPNMERMAREGTQFENCHCTSPICIPYRGILITGQWPHQSTIVSNDYFGNDDVIGVDAPTIAHTFSEAGYATGYIGKWHLKHHTVYNAGFDHFKHWRYGDDHWATPVRDVPSGEEFSTHRGYNAIGMTDQALDFVREHADGDHPFMLMLSWNPPHWRWDDAPQEFLDLYPSDQMDFRPNVTDDKYRQGQARLHYRHYHAHISAVDRELGRLMDALDDMGIADDTVLIYTSDHGSSFGSNGVGSKANPYDESIRVPFFVRWPGHVPADRSVDNLLGTIDLYPTLCGLAGISPPTACGGQDFSPVMLGEPGPDPDSLFILVNNFRRNYYRKLLEPGEWNFFYPFRGVRTKRYTYVVYAEGDWLLYDNREDPYQLHNLVDDPAAAELKVGLRRELQRWLEIAEDPHVPLEWTQMSIPDRIAKQNEHYALARDRARWDDYVSSVLVPYLDRADTEDQAEGLRRAGERVLDEGFYGRYSALQNELHGEKRYTTWSEERLLDELAAHEGHYLERLKTEAERILSSG